MINYQVSDGGGTERQIFKIMNVQAAEGAAAEGDISWPLIPLSQACDIPHMQPDSVLSLDPAGKPSPRPSNSTPPGLLTPNPGVFP